MWCLPSKNLIAFVIPERLRVRVEWVIALYSRIGGGCSHREITQNTEPSRLNWWLWVWTPLSRQGRLNKQIMGPSWWIKIPNVSFFGKVNRTMRDRAARQLVGLITQRSLVQIQLPQPADKAKLKGGANDTSRIKFCSRSVFKQG